MNTFLYVEDDKIDRMAFERFYKMNEISYNFTIACSFYEAIQLLTQNKYCVVVSDYNLGDGNALELFPYLAGTPLIIITGIGSEEIAVNAMKLGAYDYLIKDLKSNHLKVLPITIAKAIDKKQALDELENYKARLEDLVVERTAELMHLNEKLIQEIEERKKTEAKLTEALSKAEESDRLKSAFLANISHEIRTPLNGIIGFTELLAYDDINMAKQGEYINIIHKSSDQLLSIINDLMDISKIESDQINLSYSWFNVNYLLDEIYTFYSNNKKSYEVEILLVKQLQDHQANIFSDQNKIHQVINNLIDNAVKFTERGKVIFGYQSSNEFIEFFVNDSGIGIPEAYQAVIFDRFRQVPKSSEKLYGGTGLGLSICKGLVEKMGGSIWLNSSENKGSEFRFSIPKINTEKDF